MDALASAEQLYFSAVKDAIRQELKDQAAAEEKAGAYKPTMHLPKDPEGDKVNGEGDSRKAYKGERLHHLTPVDSEEVRLLVEDIARRRWTEMAIDERLVYEDMEADIAHKAHRLHQVCNPSHAEPHTRSCAICDMCDMAPKFTHPVLTPIAAYYTHIHTSQLISSGPRHRPKRSTRTTPPPLS